MQEFLVSGPENNKIKMSNILVSTLLSYHVVTESASSCSFQKRKPSQLWRKFTDQKRWILSPEECWNMLNIEIQKRFETLRHIPFCVGQSKFAFGGYNSFFFIFIYLVLNKQERQTEFYKVLNITMMKKKLLNFKVSYFICILRYKEWFILNLVYFFKIFLFLIS